MTIVGNDGDEQFSPSHMVAIQEGNLDRAESFKTADEELRPEESVSSESGAVDEEAACSAENRTNSRAKNCLKTCLDYREWSEACPRIYWFTAGVVVPLWMLIFVASFFGLGLAKLEAPNEIISNDFRLKNQYRLKAVQDTLSKVVKAGPTFCMRLYIERSLERHESAHQYNDSTWLYKESAFDIHDVLSDGTYFDILADFLTWPQYREREVDSSLVDNVTDAFAFLSECGEQLGGFVDTLKTPSNVSVIFGREETLDFGDLTFNWNRCAEGSNRTTQIDIPWGFGERTYEAFHPAAQKQHYEGTWYKEMVLLYEKHYEELLPENHTRRERAEANLTAFQYATAEASGREACNVNIPAGSWFFFTVMTTIGYGNQAPVTSEGQAMLYTLGFLSILLFAGVASRAGNITVLLFEDMMEKFRLEWLNRRFAAPVFWGSLYYIWLIVLSVTHTLWKRSRMDENPPFTDSYWFSYISTTTVGLGDIYLEPEVLVTEDLMVFSLMLLIGFVLLASFFEKLSVLVKNDDRGLKRLKVDLSNTTICCGHAVVDPMVRAGVHLGGQTVRASVHTVKASVHLGTRVVKSGVELGNQTQKAFSGSLHPRKSKDSTHRDVKADTSVASYNDSNS